MGAWAPGPFAATRVGVPHRLPGDRLLLGGPHCYYTIHKPYCYCCFMCDKWME